MFKEKDIINLEEIDIDDCKVCRTHEAAYEFFEKKAREDFENCDTLFNNTNQIFSNEEMYNKVVYCPSCNKPLIKGSMSFERAVVTWDNCINPEGDIGIYDIYECRDCEKQFALMPIEIRYNANHDICYTGGKVFLSKSDEEILNSKIKGKMLKSIEDYTERIRSGEDNLKAWNLNYWLEGDIEHAISEFLHDAGYKK